MKSQFGFCALAISLSVIFSAGNPSADNSRVSVPAGEWVQVSSASTFGAGVLAAHVELEASSASTQRAWDCRVVGQVRDTLGRPVSGVRVSLEGPTPVSGVTDENGRYFFQNLQPGRYQIKFRPPGRFKVQAHTVMLEGRVTPQGFIGERRELDISLSSSASPTPRPSPRATAAPSPPALPTATPLSSPSPGPSAQPSQTGNANTNVNTNTSVNANTDVNSNTNVNVNANTASPSLDEQINALVKGKIVYNIPAIMRLGTSSVIKVGIAKRMTEDVSARVEKDDSTTVQDLKVHDVMIVDLISEEAGAFDIRRQQPRAELDGWQAIGGDTASEWIFNVTPRQSGTHKLRLVATVLLNDPKYQNQSKSFNVYENDISVSTDYFYYVSEFIKSYWQFLLTTLLLPAGAIGWRLLKGRRKPPEPPQLEREL